MSSYKFTIDDLRFTIEPVAERNLVVFSQRDEVEARFTIDYKWLRLIALQIILLASIISPFTLKAQEISDYEDITVLLMIKDIGGYEIDALYADEAIYVNVATFFSILKINHQLSTGNDSVTGFFLDEKNRYSINALNLTASLGTQSFKLEPRDIIRNEMGLFIRNTLYGKIFGLNLNFNFRSLSLELMTAHELPVIRELRREQMRKNIDRLSGVVEVDSVIDRQYHLFKGGMADWSVISTQYSGKESDTRATLAGSTEFLGGEAVGLLNYSSITGFDERQQQYRWRWVNNESKIVKQVAAGKIPVRSTSSLYAPLIGASITNTPSSFRRSFGSYILSDYTEPGWTVELYINNVIVDFTTADASGFFSFDVPLVYGTSQITLKFIGPWGEERILEKTLNIPYNFVPTGKVEYNITGGVLRDSANNLFSRAESMVGVSRSLTIGGGVEYLSALKENNAMPFLTASAKLFNNILIAGEYTHGVKTRGLLNYRLPSNFVFELDYSKYIEGQQAISFNYLEERKASLSIPMKIGGMRSFTRIAWRQNVLPFTTYSNAELLWSSFFRGVNMNISATANWLPEGNPYIYSNAAIGFKIGKSVNVRPQAQIDVTNGRLISYKAEVEKNFSNLAHLALIFEDNLRSSGKSVELSFRYDLPFAQTAASARLSDKILMTTESARGSFSFGSGNAYVHADNRPATGRAGLVIIPFLDLNNNDRREKGEPIASGLEVRLNGGRLIDQSKDSLIRVIELEPYISYMLEVEDTGFENIAWQLKDKTFNILTDPSQFKTVNIPVKVMGEVNGTVQIRKGKTLQPQGRIIINIINESGKKVNSILSESDGYFNYLGLPPGNYTARTDSSQLKRLKLASEPVSFDFTITPSVYGDIIDNIEFTLKSTEPVKDTIIEKPDQGFNQGKNPDLDLNIRSNPDQDLNSGTRTYSSVNGTQKAYSTNNDTQGANATNANTSVNSEAGVDKNKEVDIDKLQAEFLAKTGKELYLDSIPHTVVSGKYNVSTLKWFVQSGAYHKLYPAKVMHQRVSTVLNMDAAIIKQGKYFKVRTGGFISEEEARERASTLSREGILNFTGFTIR